MMFAIIIISSIALSSPSSFWPPYRQGRPAPHGICDGRAGIEPASGIKRLVADASSSNVHVRNIVRTLRAAGRRKKE
jgi:hypothetical protein